jgi:hypothetical protein
MPRQPTKPTSLLKRMFLPRSTVVAAARRPGLEAHQYIVVREPAIEGGCVLLFHRDW